MNSHCSAIADMDLHVAIVAVTTFIIYKIMAHWPENDGSAVDIPRILPWIKLAQDPLDWFSTNTHRNNLKMTFLDPRIILRPKYSHSDFDIFFRISPN